MIIYLLSEQQKNQVDGQIYTDDLVFTPEYDIRVDWYLLEYQVIDTTNPEFLWVKTLYKYDLEPSPTQSNP